MSDHIDPDAEAVVLGTFDSLETQGFGRFSMARYVVRDLTRAGLLATPEHDAAVKASGLRMAASALYDDDRANGKHGHPLSVASWLRELADRIERDATA